MAKKQATHAPAAIRTAELPPVPQFPEQPPELVVEIVAVEAPSIRKVAVVQLRRGYTHAQAAGIVFGPMPIEFALDDKRLPELRACPYLTVE